MKNTTDIIKREPNSKNKAIVKALEDAGITDPYIADGIKHNTEAGLGVKATAADSLRGLELAARLKGYLDNKPESLHQTNVYIEELKSLSSEELENRLNKLDTEIIKHLPPDKKFKKHRD